MEPQTTVAVVIGLDRDQEVVRQRRWFRQIKIKMLIPVGPGLDLLPEPGYWYTCASD
jgi:hypothetical protein